MPDDPIANLIFPTANSGVTSDTSDLRETQDSQAVDGTPELSLGVQVSSLTPTPVIKIPAPRAYQDAALQWPKAVVDRYVAIVRPLISDETPEGS